MLVTSARTYAAFELVHKDGLKRRLHLLIRRKRGQLCDARKVHQLDNIEAKAYNVIHSRSCPRLPRPNV
jgi:hypothetical protein